MSKKNSREKLRMRIYDRQPSASSQAFLEIKKKENKIGYKYRLISNPLSVTHYIETGLADATIQDESVAAALDTLRKRYGALRPKMYIYYDRVSYKGMDDKRIRLTVDKNLLYREEQVEAIDQRYGHYLLSPDSHIMEIKVPEQQPQWLIDLLQKYQIEKQSFSKYGNAYKLSVERRKEAGQHAVVY